MPQILIKDLKFYGFHGVYPDEQIVGTMFRVDATIEFEDLLGFTTDQLEDTLNYERIVEIILALGTGQKFRLIERLVQAMIDALLTLDHVERVDITVYKSVSRLTPEPQWIGIRKQGVKTT